MNLKSWSLTGVLVFFVIMFLAGIGIRTVNQFLTSKTEVVKMVVTKGNVGVLINTNAVNTMLSDGTNVTTTVNIRSEIDKMEKMVAIVRRDHTKEYNKSIEVNGLAYADSIRQRKDSLSIVLSELLVIKSNLLLAGMSIIPVEDKLKETSLELKNTKY